MANESSTSPTPYPGPDQRLAQGRDFAPGAELDDWLTAEREIDGDACTR